MNTTSAHAGLVEKYGCRLAFSPVFRSDGDSLFLAKDLQGKEVFAVSDGTPPWDCEDGPYIIDTERVKEDGLVLVQGSGGRLLGKFHYDLKGRHCTVRSSLGVSREIARRLTVTRVTIMLEQEVRNGGPGTSKVTESFKLVGQFESAPVGDRLDG
jgi:hypothetical protein